MRRVLLSLLCLVMAFGLYGEEKGHEISTNTERYMAEKNKVWYDFLSSISLYPGSEVLERTCCQLLGIDEQQTLQQFVEERLNTYKSKVSYSDELLKQLKRAGFVGSDYIVVRPKGSPVGDCHSFELYRIYQESEEGKKFIGRWTFIYDMKNNKVLTLDDIFVPEKAAELKEKAGTDYIRLYVTNTNIYFGSTFETDHVNYETLEYIKNANDFTEQFIQSVAMGEQIAEHQRKEEEKKIQEEEREIQQKKYEEQRKQRKEENLREEIRKQQEYFASTAYRRIYNDFGELEVSKFVDANRLLSWAFEQFQTTHTGATAGNYVLETNENAEGMTDSLWIHSLTTEIKRRFSHNVRPGVSGRMSNGWDRVLTKEYSDGMKIEEGRWSTFFDIDIPADPILQEHLCKLIFNKKEKKLEEAGKRFSKKFPGKTIGKEKADAVSVMGHALSYNPEKYYSYVYGYTYAKKKKNYNYSSLYAESDLQKIGKPVLENIIYDIRNQKVLTISDVLTPEEMAQFGFNKKSNVDLALDNYNLYIGVGGELIYAYALSRENWNKFASALQDLIGPYDKLPAKFDDTDLDCQDYEGVQPTSISFKVLQEPSYGEHSDSLLVYLKSHLALPDTMKSKQSWDIHFVIDKEGHVSHAETTTDPKTNGGESFASMLTETFEQMTDWQPLELAGLGTQKSSMTYSIQFVPFPYPNYPTKPVEDEVKSNKQMSKSSGGGKGTLEGKPQSPPEFPGGDEAFFKWLGNHVHYPQDCEEQKIEGPVTVRFVVKKDGSIGEVKIVKSPHPSLSKEAERVIKLMPKWKPATIDGKPISSSISMPIMFNLNSTRRRE